MKTTMWKLKNTIKHYEWGSVDMISKLMHIDNPDDKPMAEIWMGAHPAGLSIAIDSDGNHSPIDQLISQHPTQILGNSTYQQYHSLPYLFKILSAASPLSIQVHPQRSKAKLGYENENKKGVAIDSPHRHYKDPNHKPELIYAMTPFLAMNAFRPINEIISLFSPLNIEELSQEIAQLKIKQDSEQLKHFFYSILSLSDDRKKRAISQLVNNIENLPDLLFGVIKEIINKYPDDSGVFSPLILNVIELQPGQAMFLQAQTPHAYLKGTGLEIMASSDNVLRAGLTSKYIDINELVDNTLFESIPSTQLLTQPVITQGKMQFPVPVKDFAFEIIHSRQTKNRQQIASAQIILCLEGQIMISTMTNSYTLQVGDSVFIAECAKSFTYNGDGVMARAFN